MTAPGAQGAPRSAEGAPRSIVVLGDSLSAAYGIAQARGWVALLAERLMREHPDYSVVNASISGDTSAGGAARIAKTLSQHKPAILILELGANDGLRGLPVAEMKRNLKTIVSTAKKRGIDVLLTGMEAPPNYGAAYTSEFRRAFRDLAMEERVAFMPFYLYQVAGVSSLNIADGIHPNPAGARIVEANLWRLLKPLLDKQAR